MENIREFMITAISSKSNDNVGNWTMQSVWDRLIGKQIDNLFRTKTVQESIIIEKTFNAYKDVKYLTANTNDVRDESDIEYINRIRTFFIDYLFVGHYDVITNRDAYKEFERIALKNNVSIFELVNYSIHENSKDPTNGESFNKFTGNSEFRVQKALSAFNVKSLSEIDSILNTLNTFSEEETDDIEKKVALLKGPYIRVIH